MSSLSSWIWGTSQLDDAIDKATSELLPTGSEDIALNLEICDQIRSKAVSAKDAMRALKRRLNHKNPNVQLLALSLTDVCIKNGGDQFLAEIASREFMDNLVSILKLPTLNMDVKAAILKHVQNWSFAFEGKPALGYVGQVYRTLKSEGFKFPTRDYVHTSSAIVDTQTAPEWVDSDVCLRCRTPFTFTNRKHHCRNCGLVFDQQCSAKSMALPHFGITQEVRVCDGCHHKLLKKGDRSRGADRSHRRSTDFHLQRHRSGRDLADAELQRAIQLSLQEAEAAAGSGRPAYVPSQPSSYLSEPPIVSHSTRPSRAQYSEENDPDLRAAIEASLREANAPKPSAPVATESQPSPTDTARPPSVVPLPSVTQLPNYELDLAESDAILTFNQMVEQVQAEGGRDMSRYPHVNELYEKANGLRSKLALSLDDAGRKEQILSGMNENLSQAVKLYDKLLTEQISRPTWRVSQQQQSPSPAAVSAYQPSTQFPPGHQGVNGYAPTVSQAHQAPPFSPRSQVMPPPPLAQASQTTFAQAPASSSPFAGQEASYAQAQQQTNVPQQQQQWYPVQQQPDQPRAVMSPPPAQPQQLQEPQRHFTLPASTLPQPTPQQEQLQRRFSMSPQRSQFAPPAQPLQPVQFATAPQQPESRTPQSAVQHVAPAANLSMSAPIQPPPVPQLAHPTNPHVPVLSAPVSVTTNAPVPAITSHSSPQYIPSIAQQPPPTTWTNAKESYTAPGNAFLSRHHSITAPSTPLPQFPIAPTSAPTQAWPSVPAPQPERKETLLIDL